MTRPEIGSISPFFIVRDVTAAIAFYCGRLGFAVAYREPQEDPFFAIVGRDGAMIFLKSAGIEPLPNHHRHSTARWDAYAYVRDPDGLAAEFAARGVDFSESLKDTSDGLRGFELKDVDSHVLFFGRPRGE